MRKFSSVVACVTSSSCAGVASSATAASSWRGTRSKLVVEGDANHLPMRMMAVHRISRGGHSPSSSSSTTDATTDEQQESSQTLQKKQRHPHSSSFDKKKRRSKKKTPTKIQQQQQQPVADDSDDNVIENGNCDGSINDVKKPSTSSTTATKQQSNSNNDKNDKIIQSIIQQSCYYEILGITSAKHKLGTVTSNDIKKAYRRRCVITHPDKTRNGDRTAFDKVSEAYSMLGDENKRAIYDRYGKVGLEQAASRSNTGGGGGGGSGMDTTTFFGNDLFREFFSSSSSGPTADYPFSFGGSGSSSSFRWSTPPPSTTRPPHMPKPRNRDLRYQLEVTLEELYMGSTKRVAIRQPNPLHPYYPYRKEVDVNLVPGMVHGQSIRLDGVVDSIVDAPPADVVFLLRERPHTIFARRGNDLVMELSITLSESIIGYRREIQLLDSTTIIIGNPFVTTKVKQQHMVDDNDGGHDDDVNVVQDGMTSTSLIDDVVEDVTNTTISTTTSSFSTTRTTAAILSYDLPPTIVQTGDVHVLKGFGMPKRRSGGNGDDGGGGGRRYHDNNNYGDLYVQYKVEMPGVTTTTTAASATSSKGTNVQNLLPNERVELARLLSKLEGGNSETIIKHVIRHEEDAEDIIDSDNKITDSTIRRRLEDDVDDTTVMIHHLEMSSVADFGRAATIDQQQQQQVDDEDYDDNLDELSHRSRSSNVSDFFQRAFVSGGGGGGFRYFSSSSSSSSGGRGFGL